VEPSLSFGVDSTPFKPTIVSGLKRGSDRVGAEALAGDLVGQMYAHLALFLTGEFDQSDRDRQNFQQCLDQLHDHLLYGFGFLFPPEFTN